MDANFTIGYSMSKKNFDTDLYTQMAAWCNDNDCVVVESEDSYTISSIQKDTKELPALEERIAVLEDAVNTLMEGVATDG